MLSYNQITPKTYIIFENEPWEVLSSQVFRKQKRKPVNQTKLKNLITGRVVEQTFHQSDRVAEAEIESREVKFLYFKPARAAGAAQSGGGEYFFSEKDDPSLPPHLSKKGGGGKRFGLPQSVVGEGGKFLKENSIVDALVFQDPSTPLEASKIIGIKIPIKVELRVAEAPPGVKGDTATGGTKPVTLETGATINVPLFINEGDVITVNTESGEYVARV